MDKPGLKFTADVNETTDAVGFELDTTEAADEPAATPVTTRGFAQFIRFKAVELEWVGVV